MERSVLRDDQWERFAPLLPGKVEDPGRSGADNRRFVEAVLSQPAAPRSVLLAGLGKLFGDVGQQLQKLANAS